MKLRAELEIRDQGGRLLALARAFKQTSGAETHPILWAWLNGAMLAIKWVMSDGDGFKTQLDAIETTLAEHGVTISRKVTRVTHYKDPEIWLRERVADEERALSHGDRQAIIWALREIEQLRRDVARAREEKHG